MAELDPLPKLQNTTVENPVYILNSSTDTFSDDLTSDHLQNMFINNIPDFIGITKMYKAGQY